jgi:AhpD family alkylhydroperoxidase
MMNKRLDISSIEPQAIRPLFEAGAYLNRSSLEPILRIFVSLRASQINGCAFCLAMHRREAAELGETGDRVWGLPAWREASWYSERERAALEWTEALTLVAGKQIPDDLYERVRAQFNQNEIVALTVAVNTINAWNRMNIAFHTPPEMAEGVLAQMRVPAAR